ncbi:hypothetical protein sscle_04g038400 [Sclerotinia sclerotiorum 1980 UF-70]|uniref:Uncharacterized protein n=1 Tax=Sclerotinia sclerotiorum (strain ATCC 18683 / 1980 / Ss-1) TaxID=665079 RepID=A0A1D9Q287_SCLS1|nr:hypothetical protein sscle_04g038400 [Sclerotinia sclerotiorum 1980 UF-70]
MATRRPPGKRPPSARRPQVRYSGSGSFPRGPARGDIPRKQASVSHRETRLEKIGDISEAKSSTTTIASKVKAVSVHTTRSKTSRGASFESSSISGTTIEGSSGPTKEEKEARKKAIRVARKENRNADPAFAYLPKGLNNKIRDRDPLKAKLKRLFKPKKKVVHKPLDRSQPVATPRLGYRFDRPPPAPARYIPPIAPAKDLSQHNELDKRGAILGCEFQALAETTEEREKHIRQAQFEFELRKATERRLRLEGRQQFNDPKIGRAPPITRRAFLEPARQRQTRENRSESMPLNFAATPKIAEKKPRESLPTEKSRPHEWDHAFGKPRQIPRLKDSTETSIEDLTGETTPCSSKEIVPHKLLHQSNLCSHKKPRRKLSVTFAESVESFTIPSTDYDTNDTSDTTELGNSDLDSSIVAAGNVAGSEHLSAIYEVYYPQPVLRRKSINEHSRRRSKRTTIRSEDDLEQLFLSETRRSEVQECKKDDALRGILSVPQKIDNKAMENSEGGTQAYWSMSESVDESPKSSPNSFKQFPPNLARRDSSLPSSNFHNQTSPVKDFRTASYDTVTNLLLVSNTPAPPIPPKSPLRSQPQSNPFTYTVKDTLITNKLIADNNLLLAKYQAELNKLREEHKEKMKFLRKKRQEHRDKYGSLRNLQDDPGDPLVRPQSRFRTKFSKFFRSAVEEVTREDSEGAIRSACERDSSEVEEAFVNLLRGFSNQNNSAVDDPLRSNTGINQNYSNSRKALHSHHKEPYGGELGKTKRTRQTFARVTPDRKESAQGQDKGTSGGYSSARGPVVDSTPKGIHSQESIPRPYYDALTPSQKSDFGYHYRKPSAEYIATLSEEANEERILKEREQAERANEAVLLVCNNLLRDVDGLEGAGDFYDTRGFGGRSTRNGGEYTSHVTSGALPLSEVRGGSHPSPPTASSLQSTRFAGNSHPRERRGLFGSRTQNSSSRDPQNSKADHQTSRQSAAAQRIQTAPSRQSQRVSSNASSASGQYTREESDKWISSDTLALHEAEDCDTGGVCRVYSQGSTSEKVPEKKISIDQEVTLKQEAQLTANHQRAEARREQRKAAIKAHQESKAFLPQSQEKKAEKQAKSPTSLSLRQPDQNPVNTARLRYLILYNRDRNSLEEGEVKNLCAIHYPDGNLRKKPEPDESNSSVPATTAKKLNAPTGFTRELYAPTAVNPARQVPALTILGPSREQQAISAPNSVERDRLRVDILQNNRNIFTGSPVSRGAHTFGFDSLLNSPQRNSNTPVTQVAYRSQLPQPGSSPRELQAPALSSQGDRAKLSPSGLGAPQNWSRNSSPTNQEPLISSRLRQPSSSIRQPALSPRNNTSVAGTQSTSVRNHSKTTTNREINSSESRLPVPGINVTSESLTLPSNQQSFRH